MDNKNDIEVMNISEIKEAPFNYNLHPKNQINELKQSLKEFGQFKNIVIWKNYCIAGNGLLKAAKELGLEELKVIRKDNLKEDAAKRLCIADNALPYFSDPNSDKLDELLKSISSVDDIPGVNDEWLKQFQLEDKKTIEKDPDESIEEVYAIYITCEDEQEQEKLLEELIKRKIKCRALIS